MKNKRLIALRISLIGVTALLIAGISALIFGLNQNTTNDDVFFSYSAEQYNANQVAIDTAVAQPDTTNVSIAEFSNAGVAPQGFNSSTNVITIKSAEELYKFSVITNANDACLGYKYKLITNIDYSSMTNFFEPVGWKTNKPFTGTFDGAGYEINNLKFHQVTNDSEVNTYNEGGMEYFAMFSQISSTGVVKDLGLTNTSIAVSTTTTITQSDGSTPAIFSPLAGLNAGTIQNVYAIDLNDPEEDEAGITAAGGYIISGLVGKNTGTISGAYVAYNIIVNYTVNDYMDFAEIVYENTGTLTNVYFYNRSIASYEYTNNKYVIVYDSGLIGKTFMKQAHYGTYKNILDGENSLMAAFDSLSGWYTPYDYPSGIQGAIDIDYPIRRGITVVDGTGSYANKYVATINDIKDYTYMYELFNTNAKFSSNDMVYQITADINLSSITTDSYKYDGAIASTIEGVAITGSPLLENGNNSIYPTIYNGTIMNYVTTEGIECYGLFPYVTGAIKNLNVVMSVNYSATATSNIKAIGLVSGYVDGGIIDNVSTKGNINFSSSIGKAFVGSIAGLLAGEATLSNVTANGQITNTTGSTGTYADATGFIEGIAIGGIAGYAADTQASLDSCYSKVAIQAALGLAKDYAIGGILGAGYTKTCNQLKNVGAISVTGTNYTSLYVAGGIGRLLGISQQINKIDNYGDITITGSTSATTYICGSVNADIIVTASGNKTSSKLKFNGKPVFYASGLTNGADITVSNRNNNLKLTNTININSGNGFSSTISGIYNVKYKASYDGNRITINTTPTIDMYKCNSYAPVMNAINTSSINDVKATTIYNFRDISFTTSNNITNNLVITGCVLGNNVSLNDARNEGNLAFNITNTINNTSTKFVGLIEEVSSSAYLKNSYNDGNITVAFNKTITSNIYVSGICYANRNGHSASEILAYNPTNNAYDKNAIGSIDNVINNGDVVVNTTSFASVTYQDHTVLSYNGQSDLGSYYTTEYAAENPYIEGNVFVSGIVAINESTITNTFNLGDMEAVNYVRSTTNTKEVNVGGITVLNIGKYAYILNGANNGDIKAFNLSSGSLDTPTKANVNAAGIVCRNDELENGNTYSGNSSNPNSSQIISFTINYGNVYSYNYVNNVTSTAEEPNCKSAGILAMGLCNVINVLNYGNIFGSESISGIFGIVYFNRFQSEVTSSIYISNTINYGNVYMLERGYNFIHGNTYPDYNHLTYSQLIALTNANAMNYSMTSVSRNTDYISIIGAVFAMVNFNNSNNANNIKIRYLISFNDLIPLTGGATNIPSSVTADVSSFYSAHSVTNSKTGALEPDMWMGKIVKYAPLSTQAENIRIVTAINGDNVTTATNNIKGVFNPDFEFRLAIGGDKNYLDEDNNPTDAFISDYFQFVTYKYINENLLDSIGWRAIAYSTAANDFAQNLDAVLAVMNKASGYSSFRTNALATDTWMLYCSSDNLNKLIEALIQEESISNITTILQYVFSSESQSNVLVTTEIRENILESILENEGSLQLSSVLNDVLTYSNGFSKVLADAILTDNGKVEAYLNTYINSLSDEDKITLLQSYTTYLSSNTNGYFNYGSNETERYNILTTLLQNVNDSLFYQELVQIIDVEHAAQSTTLSMYNGYKTLSTAEKRDLFLAIVNNSNNSYSNMATYLDSMENEIGYYSELVKDGYNAASIDGIYTNCGITSGSTSTDSTIINNRVDLWNQIKDTQTFKNYVNSKLTGTVGYYLATEYNNTYQSLTEPHNDGAYVGDTSQNRLGYLYETNITPEVYFYGPYINSNGDDPYIAQHRVSPTSGNPYYEPSSPTVSGPVKFDLEVQANNGGVTSRTYYSTFHYHSSDIFSSNTIMKSRGGSSSTTTYDQALNDETSGVVINKSILMYYDLSNEQFGQARNSFSYKDQTVYGLTDGILKQSKQASDPMNGSTYDTSDWSGVKFGPTTATMSVTSTGETFSLDNASITGIYYSGGGNRTLANGSVASVPNRRLYICDSTGAYHPVYGNVTINGTRFDNTNSSDTNIKNFYNYLLYTYGLKYFTAAPTTTLHSTGRNGIYRKAEPWGGQGQYFTWKQSQSTPVYTSQYIDYSARDIINLDGYLTEYLDGRTAISSDERNIINDIFNRYFLTAGNINEFKNMLRMALLESLGINATNGTTFIDNFMTTNIYSSTKINSNHPFAYLKRTNAQTVQNYLTGLATSGADNKTRVITAATSDKNAWSTLLTRLIDASAIAPQAAYADYSDLLNYLLNNGSAVSNNQLQLSVLSNLDNATLYTYLSPFDTNGNVAINTGYGLTATGAVSVNNSATYDGVSYAYGLTFTTLTVPTKTSDTIVRIIAKSTGGNATITTASGNVTVSGINKYDINISNRTSLVLNSSNNVIVYKIDIITVGNKTGLTYNETQTVGQNSTTTWSSDTIKSKISNSIGAPTSNITITNVSIVANLDASQNTNYFNKAGLLNGDTILVQVDCTGGTTVNTGAWNATNYLNYQVNGKRGRNLTNGSTSITINSLAYTITYTNSQYETITNTITNDTIVRNRYLNISGPTYSEIQNRYLSYIYKNSANNTTLHSNYIKAALLNFAPMNTSGNDANPTNPLINSMSTAQQDEFIELLIKQYNESLYNFIIATCTTKEELQLVYEELASAANGYYFINDAIIYAKNNNLITQTLEKYLIAAYITADYANILGQSQTNQSVTVYNTKMRELLNNVDSAYRYINSNGTFDNDKFDALCQYIEYSLTTSGYGIYALASNKGILNGEFIPDNIHLDDMKAKYDSTGLTDEASSYWRGGTSSNENDTTDTSSVNYAILVDMKQLKKSISTTVFTLDLIESATTTHYSSTSSIDLENHVITYYVPTGYVASTLKGKTLTIDPETKSIANLAKLTASSVAYSNADVASNLASISIPSTATVNNGEYRLANAFRVFAEDRTVYNDYDVVFKEVDFTFNLAYDTTNINNNVSAISTASATVNYKDGVVALRVTSTTLPENFDFTPYISIVANNTAMENAFSVVNLENNCVVGADHNATLVLEILKSLPAGTYTISISMFNSTPKTVTLIKSPSTECDITNCVYEGNDVVFSLNNGVYEATSYIDFGRAFDYVDLTNSTLETFYLNDLQVSDCADVQITATKSGTDIITYTVTYVITAESGASKTYKHYLVEKNPFYNYTGSTNYAFVTIYRDGSSLGTRTYDSPVFYNENGTTHAIANAQEFANASALYVRYGSGTADDPYVYVPVQNDFYTEDDYNNIYVAFTRDEGEPEFRVKYILNNFYTDGANVQYSLSESTLQNGATSIASYAGITGSIGSDLIPGDYRFEYVYTNTGAWTDGQYERTYTFPALIITKNASKDSLLKRITFLDSYTTLGNLSTVFNPDKSLRPGGPGDTEHADFELAANEENYFNYTISKTLQPKVIVDGKTIAYGSYDNLTDYFIVGAVSNAELDNYSPTFAIDKYAEMYQYTTVTKLQNYGAIVGGQQMTDYNILTTHTDILLYVPYNYTENSDTKTKVFLVAIDLATGAWSNVYETSYTGTGNAIATLTENKGSFTYNNVEYTCSPTCGAPTYVEIDGEKVYNTSLFMDYIGTPETNHFWYVSYLIFSEDYLINKNVENIQYYHISLIDLTNNVLFEIKVNSPETIDLTSLYISLSYNEYDNHGVPSSGQISCYAVDTEEVTANGLKIYSLDNNLQILPSGYFYFYIDLPDGYVASCEFTKPNQISGSDYGDDNEGSYLPPSSIVTQRIGVTITISEGTGDDISTWGVSVSDIFTRQCTIAE